MLLECGEGEGERAKQDMKESKKQEPQHTLQIEK